MPPSKLRGVAALGEAPQPPLSLLRLARSVCRLSPATSIQKLEQLVLSIKEHGILEPLLVRPLNYGEYELVAGERRYRAAQIAGLTEVPVVVRELSDEEKQLSLVENLQRELESEETEAFCSY